MLKCPVCLMDVTQDTKFKEEYKTRIYCFCSNFCSERFLKKPEEFLERHKDFFGDNKWHK